MVENTQWEGLAVRLDALLARVEQILDKAAPEGKLQNEDFNSCWAFRWQKSGGSGTFVPIEHPHLVNLDELVGVDHAKAEVVRNTAQFLSGAPANNVLLWGERGNGKSSCVKGLLKQFAPGGLRMIEVQRWDLLSLPEIVTRLRPIPLKFILFCDDLTFAEGEADFRALKTLLDGGLEERPGNVLIYATSNRRHLMPEPMTDNIGGGEIHPEEAVSEKLSLADRFGLAIGFSTFDQETFLAIVKNYATMGGIQVQWEELRREAILWALYSGRRSGRAARQFIDDLKGRLALSEP